MIETSWIGTVGAMTGSAALVIAVWTHWSVKREKVRDLRLEVRYALAEYRIVVEGLVPLLERASQSNTNIAAVEGMTSSDVRERWMQEWAEDLSKARAMLDALPDPAATYSDLSPEALEDIIVLVHGQRFQADRVQEKYALAPRLGLVSRAEVRYIRPPVPSSS